MTPSSIASSLSEAQEKWVVEMGDNFHPMVFQPIRPDPMHSGCFATESEAWAYAIMCLEDRREMLRVSLRYARRQLRRATLKGER